MTSDDVREWLDEQDREIQGCVDDLGYVEATLKTIADSVEAYTNAKCNEDTCIPGDITHIIRELESIRSRLDKEV